MSSNGLRRFSPAHLGIRTKFSLVFYLVTLIALGVVGYYGYTNAVHAYKDKATAMVKGYTIQISQKITNFLGHARSDLGFLATHSDLIQFLYWQDLGDQQHTDLWRSVTLNGWQDFVQSFDYIHKVYLLDVAGQEQFTVRRDPLSRNVQVFADSELQDQGSSRYFREAMALEKGAIVVAPVAFNREHGKIEESLVPVVAIYQPVYGENNVKYGVLVINLFANAIFKYIRQGSSEIEDGTFYLINQEGNFLHHPDAEKSLVHLLGRSNNFRTHLLGRSDNFSVLFPGVLESMRKAGAGTLLTSGYVIAFKQIFHHLDKRDHAWILVGAVSDSQALGELTDFEYLFFSILAIVVVMVFVASRIFLDNMLIPLSFVTRQLQRLSQGVAVKETISYNSEDEIYQMLNSTERLISNMESVAEQADVIARGNLSGGVELLSEHDRLGSAINNMTDTLRRNNEYNDHQNWLKDGISQLSQNLGGAHDPGELANLAISTIGRYLDAGRGVFYLPDEGAKQLSLLGSYMYTEDESPSRQFQMGEGAIGQVALEKSPIMLTHIHSDDAPITSGTTSGQPLNTYTLPLLREEDLMGVIELASFQPFNELQREFLNEACAVVASFLASVLQQRKIHNLLTIAEEAATEASDKSEKLTVVNQQMAEQQLRLQQQAEELQQTNAQMEQQQQQLQQQAVEMEEKNSDLLLSRESLNKKAQDLEQASQYKSEFLANMSHELRTPLNSIILLSKMLLMNDAGNLSGDEEKQMSVIHHAGEELLRIINDILDLSKIEAGKMELHLQEVSIDELLDEIHDLFDEIGRSGGLNFSVENRLPNGALVTDRDKLAQVVRNLLSNAFKFTTKGSVSLIVDESGRDDLPVRISVEDSGIGIQEEKQKQIFEAFRQVDGSVSRQYGGTGLGLSISMSYANLLGGTIELESEEGKGSRFIILLPRVLDQQTIRHDDVGGMVMQHSLQSAAAPESMPVHDDRQNLKSTDPIILVIDDDPIFTESLIRLNRRLGYKTLVACSGGEGLQMAKIYRPKGVLLDLGLPDMDGAEVLHKLKAIRELRRIPVYIISAREQQDGLLKQGIVGYMTKPVDTRQLADAQALILDRASGADSILLVEGASLTAEYITGIVQSDDLVIHPATDLATALELLAESPALAVVDIERAQRESLEICRELKRHDKMLPIILYGDRELSAEEEAELQEFSDSIIIKTPQAEQRILENIERFLQEVPSAADIERGAVSGIGQHSGEILKGRQILVVDDDPRNLFVVASALEQAGASVDTALNGAKALSYLREKGADINIIFMDIMMPEMDGCEAIGEIKGDPMLRHIPLVALTAKAMRSDKENLLAVGADDYLSKPVDYEVLVNMASLWCESKV